MPRRISSVQRRNLFADSILQFGFLVMRPGAYCVSRDYFCVISDKSEHCEQCVRKHRHCELAPPANNIIERLTAQALRLQEKALAAEAKAIRLRK